MTTENFFREAIILSDQNCSDIADDNINGWLQELPQDSFLSSPGFSDDWPYLEGSFVTSLVDPEVILKIAC